MARTRENSFDIAGDTIFIYHMEDGYIGQTTYREDYYNELASYTWKLGGDGVIRNESLGALDTYIMKKWYGKAEYEDFRNKGFRVGHRNGEAADCRIDNMAFSMLDESIDHGFYGESGHDTVVLQIFKDFSEDQYKITMGGDSKEYRYPKHGKVDLEEITDNVYPYLEAVGR